MIGRIISHYKILEKLGTGGMGVVYKAQDNKLGRFIALKFLPPHLAIGEEEKQRFIREARAASSLDHPNICTIHEINETNDGQMYMVMAYYQGETLKDKIERSALPLPEAIRISLQIASGLEKAHDNQIIHRDIKPANIIITSDGNVKILDFGLAKLCTQKGITKTGSTLGTVAYMSPEQTRGAELDARSDLWSLGVVIYEMITGRLPFQGEYEVAIVYSINNEEPPPATKYRNELDGSLSSIIQRCLEKNIADRYQNATELVHDLTVCQLPAEQTGSGKLFAATLSKQKKRNAAKRRKWLIGASTMAILFVVSLVAYWVTSKTESQAPLSDKVFAVFPFTVHGEQKSSYLREGMIDLLYTTINGTGDLRCSLSPYLRNIF